MKKLEIIIKDKYITLIYRAENAYPYEFILIKKNNTLSLGSITHLTDYSIKGVKDYSDALYQLNEYLWNYRGHEEK